MRCILTTNFSPWSRYSGGGQRSTHNLASALAAHGHDVHVVYTKPPWEHVEVPASLPYAVHWAALPALRSASGALLRQSTPFFVARQVARLLDTSPGAAVVHGNGEEAALVGLLRSRQRRFAFVMTPRYPALPSRPVRMALPKWRWLGRALRQADEVCPTSHAAAELVANAYGLDRSRFEIIPNGVSPEFLRAADAADQLDTLGSELSAFLQAGPFGVYFGRLAPEKGVRTLIEALGLLASDPLRFVFAGRGPDSERLQRRARELGLERYVHFVSWLEPAALARVVKRAQFAVLPSLEESFGNTLAETMALGVPLIATTAGSSPEVVLDGITGRLVTPGDAAALAAAIAEMRANPAQRRAFGEAAHARALSRFSWEASAHRFERVYASRLERA
jgi:glycosyltransferase involved in cell wall biosynthesis